MAKFFFDAGQTEGEALAKFFCDAGKTEGEALAKLFHEANQRAVPRGVKLATEGEALATISLKPIGGR